MNLSILSLGSNKGNRAKNLLKAVELLSAYPQLQRETVSSIYRTSPVYDEDQPFFYNAAAVFRTALPAEDFLKTVHEVEERIGKEKEREKGPRRIDLDILFFSDLIIRKRGFVIPHPGISERLFVLKPLMEIVPYFIHPVHKKSIRDLYFECPSDKSVEYEMPFKIKGQKIEKALM